MIKSGNLKPGEICPGLTFEEHADSLARFYSHNFTDQFGIENLSELRALMLSIIKPEQEEASGQTDYE